MDATGRESLVRRAIVQAVHGPVRDPLLRPGETAWSAPVRRIRLARQIVAVRADEAVRARVIEHPEVHPDARAVVGGAVQTHPQVQAARPLMIQRTVPRTDIHNGQGNPAVNDRGTGSRTITPGQQGAGQQQFFRLVQRPGLERSHPDNREVSLGGRARVYS
jgi:hypothetical protein